MLNSINYSTVLLTVNIVTSEDIVLARQRARQLAGLLKFDLQAQTRIATVVSEMARNAFQYATKGKVEYYIEKQPSPGSFVVRISDKGPGISKLKEILGDRRSHFEGGLGIIGSKKIMDEFIIESNANEGTQVIAKMHLPSTTPPCNAAFLTTVLQELVKNRPQGPVEEIIQQNQELLKTLTLINKSRNDLELRVQERTQQLIALNKELKNEIAERKRIEKWQHQHQQNLARVERISSMGELASALAHELNQPLAAITTYTQGCIRRLQTENYDTHELLGIMQLVTQESIRVGEIIHRMKAFVQKGEVSLEKADLNKVIKETVELMQYEVSRNRIKIIFKLTDDLPFLTIDVIQIQQVIINLIKNAIDATLSIKTLRPELIIQTKMTSSHIEVNFIDNGPGIPVENRANLLEPYFTTKEKGMGMGLSISRTIIQAHGGKLIIKDYPPPGAWLQLTFPFPRRKTYEKP